MADMQAFVESFPQFKQQSHSVNKHVALISACKDAIDNLGLFTVSKVEQTVACAPESRRQHFEETVTTIRQVLAARTSADSTVEVKAACEAALRLALLFILRYPTDEGSIDKIQQLLATIAIGNFEGLPRAQLKLLRMIRSYAKVRTELCLRHN